MLEHLFLGTLQGLTEFLPVSSSGHLVIAQRLLGIKEDIALNAAVHLATLLAVVIYFRREVLSLSVNFAKGILSPSSFRTNAEFRFACMILLGTVVTASIGFTFKDMFESLFSSAKYAGGFLIVTGAVILLAEALSRPVKEMKDVGPWDAVLVGLAQAAAICPGLSRSGTTISASLMRGIKREVAARFSFLLSIPAILGGGILQARKIASATLSSPGEMAVGTIAAFVSGLLAIFIFMEMIKRTSIRPFAYYCLVVGVIALILL